MTVHFLAEHVFLGVSKPACLSGFTTKHEAPGSRTPPGW